MNRRGFIGALAALVPASLLPAPKLEPVYKHKAVGHTLLVHPSQEENVRKLLAESTEGMVDEMSALAPNMIMHFKDNPTISVGDCVSIDKGGAVVPCVGGEHVIGRAIGRADQEIKIQMSTNLFDG